MRINTQSQLMNRRNSFSKMHTVFMIVIGAFVILGIAASITIAIVANSTTNTVSECVVNGKDRTMNQDGKSDMRVYTDNCGTFKVADSLLDGTWSSADTFASIKEGETYTFNTRGIRVPFLSVFPNITSVK